MISSVSFLTNGRLGNIFFRYASLIGLADKYGHELVLPKWEYSDYFDAPFPEGYKGGIKVVEPEFHYNKKSWSFLSNTDTLYDLKGYFQSEKYWLHCKSKVLDILRFKPEQKERVRAGMDFSKKTIAIHIRRGDYVSNTNYYQLPILYYFLAMQEFKDWKQCNVVIFSDDIEYCKIHFGCLDNVQFSENRSPIDDICLASQCDRFILSNSSFSWWMAYLSESKEVIRPNYLFDGNLLANNSDRDFWPESWRAFDHADKKIDLSDVTFCIPAVFDHPDRLQNIAMCINFLNQDLETNIIIGEQKSNTFSGFRAEYKHFGELRVFHRTKMLNELFRLSKTEIIFNWDADVFISPIQLFMATEALRSGIEMVYPYNGQFARMPREQWLKPLRLSKDIGIVGNHPFKGKNKLDKISLGGAVGFIKKKYMDIGGENENFISFGAEDLERKSRAEKLGLRVERINGALYHLDHWIGLNSSTRNPYFKANREEFFKVDKMDNDELRKYIDSWDFKK